MKLYLDPGHGGSDSGAAANGLLEKNLNLAIALKIRDGLKDYEDVQIRMSRTTDKFLSLQQRTDDANNWEADYFLSIHINAHNGTAHGYEDFIYNQLSDSSETAKIRNTIHAEIIKEVDFYNRGKKKANFHVLRESNMPAMLTESGFIDNKEDAAKLKSDAYLDKIAQGHVNGLVKAFNLKEVTKVVKTVKIQTGGLTNNDLIAVVNYFKEKGWYGQVTINWENGNPKLLSGGLTPAMRKDFEAWLEEQGFWYRVVQ